MLLFIYLFIHSKNIFKNLFVPQTMKSIVDAEINNMEVFRDKYISRVNYNVIYYKYPDISLYRENLPL